MTKNSENRSDRVRQRRGDRKERKSVQPKGRPLRGSSYSAQHFPVLMRGGNPKIPTRSNPGQKIRKRFDISLNTPGAELQLPAVPVIRLSWQWFSAMIVVGCLAGLFYLWSAPAYQVSSIPVEGLQRISAREVNLVLGLNQTPIFILNPVVMAEELAAAYPEFYDVAVEIKLPNHVAVQVDERQPVLAWKYSSGLVWVDQKGVSFPIRGELPSVGGDDADTLPVVEAQGMVAAPEAQTEEAAAMAQNPFVARQLLSPELVNAVLEIAQLSPPHTTILFDPAHGLGWKDPRGWHVYFGMDNQNMSSKLLVYDEIVRQLLDQGITPRLISLEHEHAPYYRLER